MQSGDKIQPCFIPPNCKSAMTDRSNFVFTVIHKNCVKVIAGLFSKPTGNKTVYVLNKNQILSEPIMQCPSVILDVFEYCTGHAYASMHHSKISFKPRWKKRPVFTSQYSAYNIIRPDGRETFTVLAQWPKIGHCSMALLSMRAYFKRIIPHNYFTQNTIRSIFDTVHNKNKRS